MRKKSDTSIHIGKRLFYVRNLLGFSQIEIGSFLGRSQECVCRDEKLSDMGVNMIITIAKGLGLTLEEFLYGDSITLSKHKKVMTIKDLVDQYSECFSPEAIHALYSAKLSLRYIPVLTPIVEVLTDKGEDKNKILSAFIKHFSPNKNVISRTAVLCLVDIFDTNPSEIIKAIRGEIE